jgi:thiamine-phosphate pyrophosphorylase
LNPRRIELIILEDWARFGLGNEDFVIRIKNFRQILGKNHLEIYKLSRNHIEDQCKGLSHVEQINRKSSSKIISSNSARVQEALRVIEEFSRNHNNKLYEIASEIRYEIYTLEIELLNFNNRKRAELIISENNLFSITDHREDILEIVEKILLGGVKIIQHRYKQGSDKDHLKKAIKINKLCKKYNSLFIVNDRLDQDEHHLHLMPVLYLICH